MNFQWVYLWHQTSMGIYYEFSIGIFTLKNCSSVAIREYNAHPAIWNSLSLTDNQKSIDEIQNKTKWNTFEITKHNIKQKIKVTSCKYMQIREW